MKAITVGKTMAAVGLSLMAAGSAMALPITFTGNNGSGLSATATFSVSGSDLQITLVNTGAAALTPADVLTIVYFNLNGAPTLTPVSAALGAGSSLYNPGSSLDSGSIGGNWQYKNVSGPGGATAGISTTGIGVFGPVGNFGAPTAPLDGAGFGVVHGVGAGANTGVTGRTLINNSVVFDLTLPVGYTLTSINDVGFQYGTSSDEPFVRTTPPSVPDGGMTLALLGTSLCGLGLFARRRK